MVLQGERGITVSKAIPKLTDGQRAILQKTAEGFTNQLIASQLEIGLQEVKNQKTEIFCTLDIKGFGRGKFMKISGVVLEREGILIELPFDFEDKLKSLTPAELDVFETMMRGELGRQERRDRLQKSGGTIKNQLDTIYKKLGIQNQEHGKALLFALDKKRGNSVLSVQGDKSNGAKMIVREPIESDGYKGVVFERSSNSRRVFEKQPDKKGQELTTEEYGILWLKAIGDPLQDVQKKYQGRKKEMKQTIADIVEKLGADDMLGAVVTAIHKGILDIKKLSKALWLEEVKNLSKLDLEVMEDVVCCLRRDEIAEKSHFAGLELSGKLSNICEKLGAENLIHAAVIYLAVDYVGIKPVYTASELIEIATNNS